MATTTKLQAASPNRSWMSAKQYILLALAGTLVATVIVIAISALFSPAVIYFSVTKASHLLSNDGLDLNLTVVAANPGWRAGVEYRRFEVNLIYTPENGTTTWLNPDTSSSVVSTPFVQPPRNTTTVLVPIFLGAEYWNAYLEGGKANSTPFTVEVTATVRFMICKAYTRSYDIALLCNLRLFLFDNATVSFNNNTAAKCAAAKLADN